MKLLGLCKVTLVFEGQKQEGQEFRTIFGYLLRLKPTLYYIKTLFKKQTNKKDSPNILGCISANASETSVVFLAQKQQKALLSHHKQGI